MPRHATVPEHSPDTSEWLRKIAAAVNGLLLGRSNNVFTLTLEPGETETVFENKRITPDSVALLAATTADAAVAALGIWQTAEVGQIVFAHSSYAADDMTFRLVLVG